jgi:Protein of unknown function (DUF2505)
MPRQSEYRSTLQYSAERAFSTMVDAEFLRERLAKIGGKDAALLEHTADANGARFRLRQALDSRDLPSIVRNLLSGDIVIERTETWKRTQAGAYSGGAQVVISGTPASATGTMSLRDTGGSGSELAVLTDVTVQVPIIGGTIESTVAEQVKSLLGVETDFMVAHLAQLR